MSEHAKHIKANSNTDAIALSYNIIDKSILEDLIKCDICNNIFDLNIHEPLMLKCGHTFCKKCISLKTNNLKKNSNRACPIDKMRNMMNIDLSIPNLKLEYIIKKLSNFNISSNKKQIVYIKPVKKSISPIESHNSNNAVNIYINNNNNVVHNTAIKTNNDNNIKNKKKESSANNKKQSEKANKLNFVNTIKNKINKINNINNINDINKLNIIYKNQNGLIKTMPSDINNNLNSSQRNEINLGNDNFTFEDEKFNKGNNNETFDTIPLNEEMSLGNTSFGEDVNDFLLRSMLTKKKSITEETITEEFNSSSSKNLKKLNLLGNQDSINNINNNLNDFMMQTQKLSQPLLKPSLNFSLTPNKNNLNRIKINQQLEEMNNDKSSLSNQEENNINLYGINNEMQNNNEIHQIRTVYDKIQSKLKNSSNEKNDNKEKNGNNIIKNISNNIIIINNEDTINIITDNSSSQSQEKILRNTGLFSGEQLTLISKDLNQNNNNENNDNKEIKTNQINLNEEKNIKNSNNVKKESKDNINNGNDKKIASSKISKIGIFKHIHSISDDCNDDKNKKYIDENEKKNYNENDKISNSFDSNSFTKKILGTNNNLSKSFANLSGNNFEDLNEKNNENKELININ